MLTFVLLVCVALFGAGSMQNTVTKEGLEEVFRAYFEDFCVDLSQKKELIDALEACTRHNAEEYNEAIQSCLKNMDNGATTYFEHITAACADKTLGPKFITCMDKYTDNPVFLEKVSDHAKTESCYDDVFNTCPFPKVEGIYFPKNQ